MKLTPEEQRKQEFYRDARFNGQYDNVWKTVGHCAFCEPRDKYIFHEENGIMMTVPLYAYIDGHFLIVPRRHIRAIKDLTASEWETVRKCLYIAKKIIRGVHGVKGMQIIQKDGSAAQATVGDHLHIHCIPFDQPDLSVWNYRKLNNTPVENAHIYKKQKNKISKLAARFDKKYGADHEL